MRIKDSGAQSRIWTGTPCGKSFWDFRGYLLHHLSILTHLCIPTSAASQGFVTTQNSKNILYLLAIRNPQTRLLGQRGLTKPQHRLVYFFSRTSVVVSSYKNRLSCCIKERKVESLFYKQFYYLYSALKKVCSKRLRRRFWLFYWGSKSSKGWCERRDLNPHEFSLTSF